MKHSETKAFRDNILNSVGDNPGITAKELAVKLDVQQSNLYYHLKNMIKEEKVSVKIRTTVNGINEKYYFPFGTTEGQELVESALNVQEPDVKIIPDPVQKTKISEDVKEIVDQPQEIKQDTTGEPGQDIKIPEPAEEDAQTELIKGLLSKEKEEPPQDSIAEIITGPEDGNILDVENMEKEATLATEDKEKTDQIGPEILSDVKILVEDEPEDILDVKESTPVGTDDAGQTLKNILMGQKPEKIDEKADHAEKIDEGDAAVEEEEKYDEVLIENIPFMVPKKSDSLDDLVDNTRTKGHRIIDLKTQAKVFEYLKSNYSFDVPEQEPVKIFEDEADKETEKAIEPGELNEKDSDEISNVKIKSIPFLNLTKKISFKSYELAIQQAGKSLNVLFTQNVGDKLKLLYNEKTTLPLHEHLDVLGEKIDYIISKFNVKLSRVKVSVESDQVFTQKLEFEAPDIKKKEIEELIKIKIQRELKIDPNNSYFNFNIKKFNGTPTVYAQIADADPINELIEFFKDKGLNIAYVSSLSTICAQLVEKTYGILKHSALVLYLGYSRSNILIIQQGNIVMNTRIGSSIGDLVKKMKGSVYGGSRSQEIKEQDILELLESGAIHDENNEIFNRLNIPYLTVKQLFEHFIKTVKNDMVLAIRHFQRTQSIKIKEGFLVSYLDSSDSLIGTLSGDLKFDLKEIEIQKFFNKKDQAELRDYFALLVGLSVADKREQNLLPKNIREKAVYIGRTKGLAVVSSGVIGLLVGLLIFTFSTLKMSENELESAQEVFNINKALYTNSISFQKKSAVVEFINIDLTNKVTSTRNVTRFLSYLGNELPSGIKLNTLKSVAEDEEEAGKESVYPRRFEIEGFVTSDLSNALIILEGMKDKLIGSKDIQLISFENTGFTMDKNLKLPKQYFNIVCELK